MALTIETFRHEGTRHYGTSLFKALGHLLAAPKAHALVAELRARLAGTAANIWDGTGANPYFGYLALADAIVVTGDSVSMVSEAASTGKPVYVFDLPGGSAKFRAFHDGLRSDGITRPFAGKLERWTYRSLDDTAVVAAEVRRRLELRPAMQRAGR